MRRRNSPLIAGVAAFALLGLACAGNDPAADADADGGIDDTGSGAGGAGGSAAGGSAGKSEESVNFVGGIDVETLAGSEQSGQVDGPTSTARFSNPVNLVVSPQGDLYVCDFDNGAIRKVTSDRKQVETLFQDPRLVRPFGITLDSVGNIYVEADGNPSGQVDTTTGTVWRIDPDTGEGVILAQDVGRPRGLAWRDDGMLVLVDYDAHDIRLMDPDTSTITALAGAEKDSGFVDGMGAAARFRHPCGVAWSSQGELLVADFANHAVRVVTHDGEVRTLAGTGEAGMVDGNVTSAQFSYPKDIAVAADGSVYVSDTGNHRIRVIKPDGFVETVAGNGVQGYNNGDGTTAEFFGQEGIDIHGPTHSLFIADGNGGEPLPYHRLRVLTLAP